jgi:multidrug efflux pump subunit AcrA (membrane-fusion protein)
MSRAANLTREVLERAAYLRAHPRRLAAASVSAGVVILLGIAVLTRSAVQDPLVATVRRGTLTARLTAAGLLKPAQSITYRSPLGGREAEIVFLVPEGTLVGEGDLLARLDTTELTRELERAVQEVRQAQLDTQVADAERAEGLAAIDSLTEGEGALSVEEARSNLGLAEKKVARLREAYEANRPLMEKGFLTRDELDKSAFELEQAEAELALARRKAQVYIERTHPRDRQRARLLLSQKEAQAHNARARFAEATARVKELREDIENCSIHARAAGLVVYEEHLGSAPRRKVRTGDRVTASQGLVTIPEVTRMLVEASVQEADVHRLRLGQPAVVRLDAFPDLRLTGRVARIGTLARTSVERPFEGRRFDFIVEVDPATADLRPEMTARVDVVVSEREDVLLVPVNAVFERQGLPVCHVLGPFGSDTRRVELGETDDVFAEVRSGLEEGDRVTLTDVAGGPPASDAAPAPGGRPFLRNPEPQGAPLAPR